MHLATTKKEIVIKASQQKKNIILYFLYTHEIHISAVGGQGDLHGESMTGKSVTGSFSSNSPLVVM